METQEQIPVEKIEVPKAELSELLRQNKEMKDDAQQIRAFISGVLKTVGIMGSDGKFTPEFEQEENKMAVIMKSVMSLGSDFMTMNVPVIGRAAKSRVEAFTEKIKMEKVLPILKKYANE